MQKKSLYPLCAPDCAPGVTVRNDINKARNLIFANSSGSQCDCEPDISVPAVGLEPTLLGELDFESSASTIPPSRRGSGEVR